MIIKISTNEKILNFRQLAAADLFGPNDIVDFAGVQSSVHRLKSAIGHLEAVVLKGLDAASLGAAFTAEPTTYRLITRFLAISNEISLEDGRRLPAHPPKDEAEAVRAASVMIDLGIQLLLTSATDIERLAFMAAIGDDAKNRRFRVDEKLRQRVVTAIKKSIMHLQLCGINYSLEVDPASTRFMRSSPDYVINLNGAPRAVVAVTFQSYSGGRQTRELTSHYPQMSHEARRHGVELILIADGKGLRDASTRALTQLFDSVPNTFTLKHLEGGVFDHALQVLAQQAAEPELDDIALFRLIKVALEQDMQVDSSALPVASERARLALARFAAANPAAPLVIAGDGSTLSWSNAELIRLLRKVERKFENRAAVELLAKFLKVSGMAPSPTSEYASTVAEVRGGPYQEVFLAALGIEVTASVLHDVSRESMQAAPTCRLAVLLVAIPLSALEVTQVSDCQAALAVSVVVLDLPSLKQSLQTGREPFEVIKDVLLQQSDLTKLSPFVVRGVTPDRVFFGREEEEATLLATLASNSVALLGGRRIGKTSLMQHSFSRLRSANLSPYFGDCQTVKTWTDFGDMAVREWHVELSRAFVPADLFSVVDQLRTRGTERIVIFLDEIDQLLDWDSRQVEDEVPESFFRTCRSISQQGNAQFVFSGERIIAQRIWDPSSPHWNFCRPMMLRQLSKAAAAALVSEPLDNLGVKFDDLPAFTEAVWSKTEGHPELVQLVGDGVTRLLNKRSRDAVVATTHDVSTVTENFEFAEQYLETYWGQATVLERAMSVMLDDKARRAEWFVNGFGALDFCVEESEVVAGLRMLELYGFADQNDVGYCSRLSWFKEALQYYGGAERTLQRYAARVNT